MTDDRDAGSPGSSGSPADRGDLWAAGIGVPPTYGPLGPGGPDLDEAVSALPPEERTGENAQKIEKAERLLDQLRRDPGAWLEAMRAESDPVRQMARVFDRYQVHSADREARRLAEEGAAAGGRRLRLTPASRFKLKAVRWVWADRMPLGEITLIPGREGVGKSTFLAWMAAAVTKGALPGMWAGHPRGVLYAATEDSWEYTIAPRMVAAGADMDRVFRVDVEHEEGRFGKLSLPVDTRLIPDAAHEHEASVLMCDPVISLVSDQINTFKAQELRGALEPLKRAAEEAGICVAALVHFNKAKDTDVLSMISGSRAWSEVARAVIAIARDKDADEYTCVVSQVKNNLGKSDLPHLTYTIDNRELRDEDGGPVHIGALRWMAESERGVEDLLAQSHAKDQVGDTTKAVIDFVTERYAASGRPVLTKDVTERFADQSADNVRKILSRCVARGGLRKVAHGHYAPPEGASKRPCPGCGKTLGAMENFCRPCQKGLDDADRKETPEGGEGDDGALFPR